MPGREFLELARELLASGTAPRHWRAVIIHAYYALFLECREAMSRWGLPPLPRLQAHSEVRLRLIYSRDPDLKEIGNKLERLGQRRSRANYDLQPLPVFASPAQARQDVKDATAALTLLDAIDADPARRAAAIASITP
jgi:hypothetical protein